MKKHNRLGEPENIYWYINTLVVLYMDEGKKKEEEQVPIILNLSLTFTNIF